MYADIVLSLRLLRPPHLSARFGRVWQLVQSRRKFVYCNAPHPTTIACCAAQLTFLSHTCARRYIFCSLASTFALLTRSTTLSSSSFDADMFRSTSPVLVFSLHAVLSNWSNVDARPVHRVQQACNVYACRKPPCTVGVGAPPGAAIRGFGTRNTGDTEMVLRRCPPSSLHPLLSHTRSPLPIQPHRRLSLLSLSIFSFPSRCVCPRDGAEGPV